VELILLHIKPRSFRTYSMELILLLLLTFVLVPNKK